MSFAEQRARGHLSGRAGAELSRRMATPGPGKHVTSVLWNGKDAAAWPPSVLGLHMDDKATATPISGGFLARQHNKLRFNELPETFFARVILAKCSDSTSKEITQVQLSLSDLFRTCKPGELE